MVKYALDLLALYLSPSYTSSQKMLLKDKNMHYQTIKPGTIIATTPFTEAETMFNKAVILITEHDKNGTKGLIINKLINKIDSRTILKSLGVPEVKDLKTTINFPLHAGGPVEPDKGLILHSGEYTERVLLKINEEFSITADSRIIVDVLFDKGPIHKMMILGHAAWIAGQLEDEIKNDFWVVLPDDKSYLELVFSEDNTSKWDRAIFGIATGNYSNIAGHA